MLMNAFLIIPKLMKSEYFPPYTLPPHLNSTGLARARRRTDRMAMEAVSLLMII